MSVAEPESAVHSQLVKTKSSRLFSCVGTCRHTNKKEEVIFTANHLETITIIADMHREASGLLRAVTGTIPGASY